MLFLDLCALARASSWARADGGNGHNKKKKDGVLGGGARKKEEPGWGNCLVGAMGCCCKVQNTEKFKTYIF